MIEINRGEHGLIMGKTGSGKTQWAKSWLLRLSGRSIIVDTEDGIDFPKEKFYTVSVADALHLARSSPDKRFLVRIDTHRWSEEADTLFQGLLRSQSTLLYVDEANDFSRVNDTMPSYVDVLRKGRKHGLSVWSSTQRPALIDKTIYTQATHKVFFTLSEYDIKSWVGKFAQSAVALLPQAPFKSYRWVYEAPSGELHLFEPVKMYSWPDLKRGPI